MSDLSKLTNAELSALLESCSQSADFHEMGHIAPALREAASRLQAPAVAEVGRLDLQTTARGFVRADFTDRYGQHCSLQESSLAEEACIWLGVDVDIDGNAIGARMHLTQENVQALLPALHRFAATGELTGAAE